MHLVSLLDDNNTTRERDNSLKVRKITTEYEKKKLKVDALKAKVAATEKKVTEAALGARSLDDQLTAS